MCPLKCVIKGVVDSLKIVKPIHMGDFLISPHKEFFLLVVQCQKVLFYSLQLQQPSIQFGPPKGKLPALIPAPSISELFCVAMFDAQWPTTTCLLANDRLHTQQSVVCEGGTMPAVTSPQ